MTRVWPILLLIFLATSGVLFLDLRRSEAENSVSIAKLRQSEDENRASIAKLHQIEKENRDLVRERSTLEQGLQEEARVIKGMALSNSWRNRAPVVESSDGKAPPVGSQGSAPSSEIDPSQGPDIHAIIHRNFLRSAWRNYHDSVSNLGLTPENELKLLHLLCARDEEANGTRAVASMFGASQVKEFMASIDVAHSTVNSDIKGLLGENAFDVIDDAKTFEKQKLMVINTLGIDLAMDGAPLTPDQMTALAHIYHDSVTAPRKTVQDKFGQLPLDPQTGLDEIDQMLIDHASEILSPTQMRSIRRSLVMTHQETKLAMARGGIRAP